MYTLPSLISRRERRPSEVRVGMRITIREKRLWLGDGGGQEKNSGKITARLVAKRFEVEQTSKNHSKFTPYMKYLSLGKNTSIRSSLRCTAGASLNPAGSLNICCLHYSFSGSFTVFNRVNNLSWSATQPYLYSDLPWMVARLEKTDRSFSSLGHDWMFRMSDNKTQKLYEKWNKVKGNWMHSNIAAAFTRFVSINKLSCMYRPVISLTVRNTSSFLASKGGMFLKSSLWRRKTSYEVDCMTAYSETLQSGADSYPRIPVTRKWRLPWILVQLMKLSMLLESTVCLCSAPVPSHTTGTAKQRHWHWWLTNKLSVGSAKCLLVLTFGAESTAELTLPLAFSLHLHLVWGTDAHAGAAIHHKMSYKEREKEDDRLQERRRISVSDPASGQVWYHHFTRDTHRFAMFGRLVKACSTMHKNKQESWVWPLTGTLGDTDGSVLIFGIGVGLHLKRLLVVDQSLGTLWHTGSRVVEMTTCLVHRDTHTHQPGTQDFKVCYNELLHSHVLLLENETRQTKNNQE